MATFLRNLDAVDLSQLSEDERQDVFAVFGPDRRQQLYGRGIRRRLATMFDGGQRQLRMAHSLQFTMPGRPILRYGDEIGMGEDLRLPGRDAIRTPMHLVGDHERRLQHRRRRRPGPPVIAECRYSCTSTSM